VNPVDAKVEGGLLASLLDDRIHLLGHLLDHILDACRVNAAIGNQFRQ
jgi:hypothetical protein